MMSIVNDFVNNVLKSGLLVKRLNDQFLFQLVQLLGQPNFKNLHNFSTKKLINFAKKYQKV